MYTELRVI